MRSVPQAVKDELAKENLFPVHLIEVQTATPVYYTDLDLDLVYGGKTYLSRGLTIGNCGYSLSPEVDRTSFDIDNTDLTFSAFGMGAEEWRGKICTISLAVLSSQNTVIGSPMVTGGGIINAIHIDQTKAHVEILGNMVYWRRKLPRLKHSAFCPWEFKGSPPRSLCRYSGGETWCDQSYDRCMALNNQANFGGFRWLPSLVNKKIWWGRAPK